MARQGAGQDWARYATADGRGVELLHAHYVQHVYERHTHDTYAIGVTEEGVQAFNCRGASHASTTGTIMAFNPAEPHDGRAATPDGFTYRMLYIDPARVEAILDDACGKAVDLPFFRSPLIRDTRSARLVHAAHKAFAEPALTLERDALLMRFVVELATRHGDGGHRVAQAGAPHGALCEARDFLHANFAAEVSAEDLARISGISQFHLSRQFSSTFGLPPHAYQLQLRLREAKRLLAEGTAPADVAATVGFADQSHLSRRFKGTFGITPGQFARAARNGSI